MPIGLGAAATTVPASAPADGGHGGACRTSTDGASEDGGGGQPAERRERPGRPGVRRGALPATAAPVWTTPWLPEPASASATSRRRWPSDGSAQRRVLLGQRGPRCRWPAHRTRVPPQPARAADAPNLREGEPACPPPPPRAFPGAITFRVIGFVLLVAAVPVAAYFVLRWYAYDNWIVTAQGTDRGQAGPAGRRAVVPPQGGGPHGAYHERRSRPPPWPPCTPGSRSPRWPRRQALHQPAVATTTTTHDDHDHHDDRLRRPDDRTTATAGTDDGRPP